MRPPALAPPMRVSLYGAWPLSSSYTLGVSETPMGVVIREMLLPQIRSAGGSV